MAKSSASSGYQSLGNGVFRVGGVAARSAMTGRYITTTSVTSRQSETARQRAKHSN